jgi:hypothetical protein
MSDFVQLDLFADRPNFDRPPKSVSLHPLVPQELSDERLIAAIPEAMLADGCALATEAGKRRLSAAIPALMSLCNRFVGYGNDVGVPEQAAALAALGAIGGPEASRAVVQLIVRRIVQGPTLARGDHRSFATRRSLSDRCCPRSSAGYEPVDSRARLFLRPCGIRSRSNFDCDA